MTNRTRTNRSRTAIAALAITLAGVVGGVVHDAFAASTDSHDVAIVGRKAGGRPVEY